MNSESASCSLVNVDIYIYVTTYMHNIFKDNLLVFQVSGVGYISSVYVLLVICELWYHLLAPASKPCTIPVVFL